MGKGSNTTTTNQSQTYAPTGAGYIQSALQQGQNAAQLPFNIPQAPVAGFSQDQLSAFQNVNNAQGMAQPYINQAQQYFSPQGAQSFFNPAVDAVTAQMQNIFGQQQQQNNANLVQSAGGVGADRIAVGQGNLANQQGLAAGQTYSNLWNSAVQQAQGAGYGTAALGSQAQNAALQGAQAQLGTGGLQQQLSQAQMNSPYQLALAQAAFPYQQAQFNAGITGSLAPALGGTTTGQGTTTGPSPSMLSQILGLGTAGLGAAGSMGAFGGSPSYGGGSALKGDAYGGSGANPLQGLSASDYGAGFARGGSANPFAFAEGGSPYGLPSGLNDNPINVDQESVIPHENLAPAQVHMPSLNLNPPAGGGGKSGSGDAAAIVGDVAKIAGMFLARGGPANPWAFADGGTPDELPDVGAPLIPSGPRLEGTQIGNRAADIGTKLAAKTLKNAISLPKRAIKASVKDVLHLGEEGYEPQSIGPATETALRMARGPGPVRAGYAEGGTPDFNDRFPAMTSIGEVSAIPPSSPIDAEKYPSGSDFNPYRMPPREAVQAWEDANPVTDGAALPPAAMPTAGGTQPVLAPSRQEARASAQDPEAPPEEDTSSKLAKSPWMALMAAGLGIAGGTSPFAAVNIGQGGLQGIKALEEQRGAAQKDTSIAQAAKRLELEAKHHEDQYTRSTPYQQFEMRKPVPIGQRMDPTTGLPMTTYGIPQSDGTVKPVDASGKAVDPNDPAALPPKASPTQGWIPGKNVPQGVDPSVLEPLDTGMANLVRSIDEGRATLSDVPMRQRFMVEKYLHAYDSNWDKSVWTARNKQQSDLTTNGTAGKMLTATNQLLPHLGTAYDSALKLANTDYPAANTIKNWWLTQTGDPRVKEFATVREVAAMDAARLLRGTGQMAEKDIEAWRDNIASQGSPQQLVGVLKMLGDDLIGARITSLQHAYRMNMRQEPPEFLSPEAKTALDKIRGGGTAAPAAAAPAAGAAPAAAQAKPPVVYQNGHAYQLQPDGSYK